MEVRREKDNVVSDSSSSGDWSSQSLSLTKARRARQAAARAATDGKLAGAFKKIEELEEELDKFRMQVQAYKYATDGQVSIVVDRRIASRLEALQPCLIAQHVAAEKGEQARSARGLVDVSTNLLANAAKHFFQKDLKFEDTDAGMARKAQRQSRRTCGATANEITTEPERIMALEMSDCEDQSTEAASSEDSVLASGQQSFFIGECFQAEVQTDLSFGHHGKACRVAENGLDATIYGITVLEQERLAAHAACEAEVRNLLDFCAQPDGEDAGVGLLETVDIELQDASIYESLLASSKASIQRSLHGFHLAFNAYASEADGSDVDNGMIGGDDGQTASKKALKQRSKRKRKRIETLMTKVLGKDIVEARVNSKEISMEELASLEDLLALEKRGPMKPSRRKRRLAWALWLNKEPIL